MSLNELKWAQIILNKPKWGEKSLNELKFYFIFTNDVY